MAKATKFDKREPESNSEYSSSSEDVEEDEDGEELTPALDAAILSTLGRIRRKEGVYGSENVLAEALKEAEQKAKGLVNVQRKQRGNDKPFTLSDHHRAALLSGFTGEEEVEEPLTNVQAEIKLRHEAINAFHQLAGDEADDEDESGGGFLAKRVKDDNEDGDDEEEYRKFMLDVGGGEAEVRRILGTDSQSVPFARQHVEEEEGGEEPESAPQKKVKGKAPRADLDQMKAKADDDFLMNYILNRGWIDKTIERVPTYKDIVGEDKPAPGESEEGNNQAGPSHPWGELEEEDEFDEKAEEFETAYNFRFEEPGSTSISTHPRNIDSLVRRPDDARKSKRQAKAERKAAERAVQEEETRKQKGKKRREMEKQLEQLKAELGDSVDWKALEKVVDGEWDEEEWERVIGGMLSGAADAEDEAKPSWDDDVDYGDYGDDEEGEEYEEAYAQEIEDDAPINMDADFIDEQPQKKRKKDKKGKGRAQEEDVVEDLTVADRALKVKETMEEYQKLDHEDIIGDLPTRFKYASGPKIDFGLTPAEILLATDAELNALASVKHIAPYRRGGMGKTAQGMNRRVRDLKEQLRQRKWGEEEIPASAAGGSGSNAAPVAARKPVQAGSSTGVAGTEARDADGKKKRLGKKQRQKAKLAQESGEPAMSSTAAPVVSSTQEGKRPRDTMEETPVQAESAGQEGSSKKRRKKNKNKSQAVIEP